jgi:hypothetical protein
MRAVGSLMTVIRMLSAKPRFESQQFGFRRNTRRTPGSSTATMQGPEMLPAADTSLPPFGCSIR